MKQRNYDFACLSFQWVYWHQWGIRKAQHSEVCAYSVEQSPFSVALLTLVELVTACLVNIAMSFFIKRCCYIVLKALRCKTFKPHLFVSDVWGRLYFFFFPLSFSPMKLINQSCTCTPPQVVADKIWWCLLGWLAVDRDYTFVVVKIIKKI